MLIENFKWDVDFPEDLKGDDSKIEKLWDCLTDILLDDNECLVSDWKLWKAGTNKEEIWLWFDKHHTKGVYYLLYER